MIVPVQKDQELLDDFRHADNVSGALHLWWLGHSGFLMKWNGHGFLIDPYLSDSMAVRFRDQGKGWPRLMERTIDPLLLSGIDLIFCSHNHLSHLDPETILEVRAASPSAKLVIPAGTEKVVDSVLGKAGPQLLPLEAGSFIESGGVTVHGITASNARVRTAEKGPAKSLGFVITMGPFVVYYSGDTLWHTSLVREIRRWNINLAILPISGYNPEESAGSSNLNGFEAAALAKAVSAGLAVPCHYDMFTEDTVSPEEFIYCCERLNQKYRILQPGLRLTMGPMIDPGSGRALPTEAHSTDWGLGY